VAFVCEKAAKVYLDSACLEDGEPWQHGFSGVGGFVGALRDSVVFVPLISWTKGEDGRDRGSVGQLMELANGDFVDNVLLEWTVALFVVRSPRCKCRSILPILIGDKDRRGIYSPFPFENVQRLPDKPSAKTNEEAAHVLRKFGLDKAAMEVGGMTIRGVTSRILSFQGVQLSNEGIHSKAVGSSAERILTIANKHIVECMEKFIDKGKGVKAFTNGTPCGFEVLAWLKENGLSRYIEAFAAERLDSLLHVSKLDRATVERIVQSTHAAFRTELHGYEDHQGGEQVLLPTRTPAPAGDVADLVVAIERLQKDPRARTLTDRMLWYDEVPRSNVQDGLDAFVFSTKSGSGLEVVIFGKSGAKIAFFGMGYMFGWLAVGTYLIWSSIGNSDLHVTDRTYLLCTGFMGFSVISVIWMRILDLHPPPTTGKVCSWVGLLYTIAACALWISQEVMYADGSEDPMPRSLLRVTRWPMLIVFTLTDALLGRFMPTMHIPLTDIMLVLGSGWVAICCFLGEDPDSNVMAWVATIFCITSFLGGQKWLQVRKVQHRARTLLQNEMLGYIEAWNGLLAREGSREAIDKLSTACSEICADTHAEWQAFEKTVPRFGPHFWYLGCKPVRGGPFTITGKPRQQLQDLDLLFRQARIINSHFLDWVKSWDEWGVGLVRHVAGPVKHAQRAIQKCVRTYFRDPAAISDLVRCTVVYEDIVGVQRFFERVRERSDRGGSGMLKIRRVKNRFNTDFDAAKETVGYRDLSLLVEVGFLERGGLVEFVPAKEWESLEAARHICEIQVHARPLYTVKQAGSHEKYVSFRDWLAS